MDAGDLADADGGYQLGFRLGHKGIHIGFGLQVSLAGQICGEDDISDLGHGCGHGGLAGDVGFEVLQRFERLAAEAGETSVASSLVCTSTILLSIHSNAFSRFPWTS